MIERWRTIEGDADLRDAAPLSRDEGKVRVTGSLSDASHLALASLLGDRPDVQLWIDDRTEELELLRHYPGLQRLGVTSLRLETWDGVAHVADTLTELHMGDTLKPISIAPFGALRHLTALGIHGPVRNVEVIGQLSSVEDLQLRSVTLPDLSLLLPMRRLTTLWIGLGGTADLSLLPRFELLNDLELWRIRGLRNVATLGDLPALRRLMLQSMSSVTELPSLRGAASLRRLALETMRGIADLTPIADAPALEELLLIEMPHLSPDSLRPFIGHPTLRRGIWGFGSTRKNVAAYDLLPLGDPPYGHPTWAAWMESRATAEG